MTPSIDAILETAAKKPVVPLWPATAPGVDTAAIEGEPERGKFNNIKNPTLTVYVPPADRHNGTGVVICPGGGYGIVSCINEGYPIAEWLNTLGITAFVLKYRLPATADENYHHPIPLADAQQAMRIVRTLAPELDIKPDRIGIIGFSAGGHLAATASTLYDRPVIADPISCAPDFALLIYSVISQTGPTAHAGSHVNLVGPYPNGELIDLLTPYKQVTSKAPPMFLAHAKDDGGVPYQNSVLMYDALSSHGVDAELHLYEQGGHGFGLGKAGQDSSQWPEAAEAWLRAHPFA